MNQTLLWIIAVALIWTVLELSERNEVAKMAALTEQERIELKAQAAAEAEAKRLADAVEEEKKRLATEARKAHKAEG